MTARILLLLLLIAGPAFAEDGASGFDAGNKLYEQGKTAEAAAAYEKLIQSGQRSVAVYFNLGNAYFKSAQIGRAVAAYREAERLNPRDPDVRANLRFARNQIQGPTLASSRWQRWLGRLTVNEWALLMSASLWVWFLSLATGQWRPAVKANLRGVTLVFALLAVAFAGGLASDLTETRGTRIAFVTTQDAAVRHGPLDESPTAFTVHDGAELLVLDQKDQWLQVSTDAQRLGWIRRDQVLLPPRA
jgi:tetratricopeptide (TPR) repeat protein